MVIVYVYCPPYNPTAGATAFDLAPPYSSKLFYNSYNTTSSEYDPAFLLDHALVRLPIINTFICPPANGHRSASPRWKPVLWLLWPCGTGTVKWINSRVLSFASNREEQSEHATDSICLHTFRVWRQLIICDTHSADIWRVIFAYIVVEIHWMVENRTEIRGVISCMQIYIPIWLLSV